ncbi:MAG: acylphosphatase [Pseudomonadota bacterium]
MIRRRLLVHGVVQGVGFRASVARRALAVAGWARNLPDGSVEVVLEGEPDAVAAVEAFVREGPRGALVTEVEASDEQPEGLAGFGFGPR